MLSIAYPLCALVFGISTLDPERPAGLEAHIAQEPGDGILRERRSSDPHSGDKDRAEGEPPPALASSGWLNCENGSLALGDLVGRVVLVVFFDSKTATDQRILPKLAVIAQRRADAGLTVLGVHAQAGGEKLQQLVEEFALPFPVLWDREGDLARAWMVDDTPDYWLIDRAGRVRVADLAQPSLSGALGRVLAEGRGPAQDPAALIPTAPVDARIRTLASRWPEASFGVFVNGVRLGNYILRNRLEEVPREDRTQLELVVDDELNILFHSIELSTRFRARFAVDGDRARLRAVEVFYGGRPGARGESATKATLQGEGEKRYFRVRGQSLTPSLPVFTDVFLARLPALIDTDFDPSSNRSWMNFVDGRLYDGVRLQPTGEVQLTVLGREQTCQRWTLRGDGLAAPSIFDFDQQGQLVHALLEKTQEYILERAPENNPEADGQESGPAHEEHDQ